MHTGLTKFVKKKMFPMDLWLADILASYLTSQCSQSFQRTHSPFTNLFCSIFM